MIAKETKPELPNENLTLETIDEGSVAQALHVGPYADEEPTITRIHPRRTSPAKLKTVVRIPFHMNR